MPDNQSGTLCAGSEVSRFKNVASDKEGINKSNSLIAWRIWWGLRARNSKFFRNYWINKQSYFMARCKWVGKYSVQWGPCTYSHNRGFPRNESEHVNWGARTQTSLALCRPFGPRSFISTISNIVTWSSAQKFLRTPLSGVTQKCFQSGPDLAKTGPAHNLCDLLDERNNAISNATHHPCTVCGHNFAFRPHPTVFWKVISQFCKDTGCSGVYTSRKIKQIVRGSAQRLNSYAGLVQPEEQQKLISAQLCLAVAHLLFPSWRNNARSR